MGGFGGDFFWGDVLETELTTTWHNECPTNTTGSYTLIQWIIRYVNFTQLKKSKQNNATAMNPREGWGIVCSSWTGTTQAGQPNAMWHAGLEPRAEKTRSWQRACLNNRASLHRVWSLDTNIPPNVNFPTRVTVLCSCLWRWSLLRNEHYGIWGPKGVMLTLTLKLFRKKDDPQT